MAITFRVGGVQATIAKMKNLRVREVDAARLACAAAGAQLLTAARTSVMLRDHSPADLAALDHPYATRHGSIQTGALGHSASPYLTDRANQVHSQSGRMLAALRGQMSSGFNGGLAYRVGWWGNVPKHVPFVIRGTSHMLPRDVLTDMASSPGTRKAIMQIVTRVFGAHLRLQAMARFTKAPVSPGAGVV